MNRLGTWSSTNVQSELAISPRRTPKRTGLLNSGWCDCATDRYPEAVALWGRGRHIAGSGPFSQVRDCMLLLRPCSYRIGDHWSSAVYCCCVNSVSLGGSRQLGQRSGLGLQWQQLYCYAYQDEVRSGQMKRATLDGS